MTRRFYTNGDGGTTLVTSINAAVTAFNVQSAATFPSATPFTAVIDYGSAGAEAVLVTGVSGQTVTVTRGYNGTTAVSHASSAPFQSMPLAIDLDEANIHHESTLAVHGVAGAVVGTTDAQQLSNKTLVSPVVSGNTTGGTDVTLSGKLTGVLAAKQFANEAAAGSPPTGSIVYLTAPTGLGYVAGEYEYTGSAWVPLQRNTSSTGPIQRLAYVPAGNNDTPAVVSTAVWFTLGNVTVPAWATKAFVSLSVLGVLATTTGNNVTAQLKIGTPGGVVQRILDHGSATGRFPYVIHDQITGLTPGVQSVTANATFVSGTGLYRIDAQALVTALFHFLP